MSETLIAVVTDGFTGETIERELTADELAERQADEAQEATRQAEVIAKATARESALAKLAELGLTAEEIAAL